MDLGGKGIGGRPPAPLATESLEARLQELGREGSRLATEAFTVSRQLAQKLRRSAFELLGGEELQELRESAHAAGKVAKSAAGDATFALNAAMEAATQASEAAAAAGEALQASLAARAEIEAMTRAAVASLNESISAGREAANAAREAAQEAAREASRAAMERLEFEQSGPAGALGGDAMAVLQRLEQDYVSLSELIRELHTALAPQHGDSQPSEGEPEAAAGSFDLAAEDRFEVPEQAPPRVWPSLRRAV